MSTISKYLIDTFTRNIVGGIGQSYGLLFAPDNSLGQSSQSSLLRLLGVGTNSYKYIYTTYKFKSLISEFPDFTSHINICLRKRKSDYSLSELLNLSTNVIVQINKSTSKASILFVARRKKLVYSLILIGSELQSVKDELYMLATGGIESE